MVESVLALAAKLRDQTNERLLATSDAEVGLEWLLGGGEGRGGR